MLGVSIILYPVLLVQEDGGCSSIRLKGEFATAMGSTLLDFKF